MDEAALLKQFAAQFAHGPDAVSYTHLDVYKRQVLVCDVPLRSIGGQVELALATGLARLVNGIQHMLLGNGVI